MPATSGIPEQIERGAVGPLRIVDENHDRAALGEGVDHPAHRLEQTARSDAGIDKRSGKIGIAIVQLWQDSTKLGEPDIAHQVVRCVLSLESIAQGADEYDIGQVAPDRPGGVRGREGTSAQHVGALGGRPRQKLLGEARLANASFPLDGKNARRTSLDRVIGRYHLEMLGLTSDESGLEAGDRVGAWCRPGSGPHPLGKRKRRGLERHTKLALEALSACLEDALRSGLVTSADQGFHEPPETWLVQWIQAVPAFGGPDRGTRVAAVQLFARQSLEQAVDLAPPVLPLKDEPFFELGRVREHEAFEKETAAVTGGRFKGLDSSTR